MGKNAVRHLSVLALCILISFSFCGCFWGVHFSTREEKEPEVIEYVQKKYDFTPQTVDWKFNTVMNKREHYAILSDGNKEFTVHVDFNDQITDNYETDKFDEAVTEWFDSNLPGIYHAHVEESFYALDERFEDDVWEFYRNHRSNIRITATYTGKNFADETSMSFLSKLGKMDIYYSIVFLSCPTDEAAQVVCDKSFPNGYNEILFYAPYVDESLQIKNNADPVYHTYEVRYHDDMGYMECLNNGSEPLPHDTYSVENSGISLSDVCPTYRLRTDFINGDDKINVIFFIPLSQINDEVVLLDYYGSFQVNNMEYIYGRSKEETHLGAYSIYGEYAAFKINGINGDIYFSVKSKKT